GEAQLHARECLPGQHRLGTAESVALPGRRALSLHLRRRPGALLLAAARLSRRPAGEIRDLRRDFYTEKSCAPHCTVSCVHQVSILDAWRGPQRPAIASEPASGLVQI